MKVSIWLIPSVKSASIQQKVDDFLLVLAKSIEFWSDSLKFSMISRHFSRILKEVPVFFRLWGGDSARSLVESLAYSCMCLRKWSVHFLKSTPVTLQHPISEYMLTTSPVSSWLLQQKRNRSTFSVLRLFHYLPNLYSQHDGLRGYIQGSVLYPACP